MTFIIGLLLGALGGAVGGWIACRKFGAKAAAMAQDIVG